MNIRVVYSILNSQRPNEISPPAEAMDNDNEVGRNNGVFDKKKKKQKVFRRPVSEALYGVCAFGETTMATGALKY